MTDQPLGLMADTPNWRQQIANALMSGADYAGRGAALADLYLGGMLHTAAGLVPGNSIENARAARDRALEGVPRDFKAMASEPINPLAMAAGLGRLPSRENALATGRTLLDDADSMAEALRMKARAYDKRFGGTGTPAERAYGHAKHLAGELGQVGMFTAGTTLGLEGMGYSMNPLVPAAVAATSAMYPHAVQVGQFYDAVKSQKMRQR